MESCDATWVVSGGGENGAIASSTAKGFSVMYLNSRPGHWDGWAKRHSKFIICFFKQFMMVNKQWYGPNRETYVVPKDDGQGVMISAFQSQEFGFGLEVTNEDPKYVQRLCRSPEETVQSNNPTTGHLPCPPAKFQPGTFNNIQTRKQWTSLDGGIGEGDKTTWQLNWGGNNNAQGNSHKQS